MQTDDPVSRCGPGKGIQSSISLPEVKILYLKDLSLDDGEDGDNQLERPDHSPEGAPRQVSSPGRGDRRRPRCRGRNPDQTRAREPSRTPEGQDRLEGIRGGGPETPQGVDPLTDFLLDTVALVRHLEDSLPDGPIGCFGRRKADDHGSSSRKSRWASSSTSPCGDGSGRPTFAPSSTKCSIKSGRRDTWSSRPCPPTLGTSSSTSKSQSYMTG